MAITEKQLDRALEVALQTNPAFFEWMVSQTKFANAKATFLSSRSNHPWSKVPIEQTDVETGTVTVSYRESETDILVLMTTEEKQVVALHIENKLGNGRFTSMQAEMYPLRAEAWVGKERYGGYQDWDTVLVAPLSFLAKHPDQAALFGTFIAHERIAAFVPQFASS